MADELQDLMTRLADEAGPTRDDPTLWHRAQRSRQRRGWVAASAVAAVLAIVGGAVVGVGGRGQPSTPGGVADSYTSPPRPDVPTRETLEPGTYRAQIHGRSTARVTVDLPEGFNEWSGEFIHASVPAYGVGFWDGEALKLNTESCAGTGTVPFAKPGPTVADFAAALADAGRRATDPVPVSLGGYDGLYVELTLPAASSCDPRSLWFKRGGPSVDHLEPGVVDRIWILDVDGHRLLIDAFHFPGVKASEVAVLTDIVESTTITVPAEPSP